MRYLVPCMMIGIIHTRDDEGGHDGHASPPFAVTAMLHYFSPSSSTWSGVLLFWSEDSQVFRFSLPQNHLLSTLLNSISRQDFLTPHLFSCITQHLSWYLLISALISPLLPVNDTLRWHRHSWQLRASLDDSAVSMILSDRFKISLCSLLFHFIVKIVWHMLLIFYI